jgi:predicted nucleic acid-binding protein
MNAKQFVDTNILIYAHDATTGRKHERASAVVGELWRTRSGVISTQVLQELAVNLRKKVAHPPDDATVRELLTDYLAWEVVVNDGGAILEALDLQARYKLSFWDALIVQAANASGAEVLLSEDLAGGQVYGEVQVVNPFAEL